MNLFIGFWLSCMVIVVFLIKLGLKYNNDIKESDLGILPLVTNIMLGPITLLSVLIELNKTDY